MHLLTGKLSENKNRNGAESDMDQEKNIMVQFTDC